MRRRRRGAYHCPCGHVHQPRPHGAVQKFNEAWGWVLAQARYGDPTAPASLVILRRPDMSGVYALGAAMFRAAVENV